MVIGGNLIARYVVNQAFGSNKEGDIIDLDTVVAERLGEEFVREATPEDITGDTEETETEEPVVSEEPEQALMKKLSVHIDKEIMKSVKKVQAEKAYKMPTVPAQPKEVNGGFDNFGEFLQCLNYSRLGNSAAQSKMYKYRMSVKAPTGHSSSNGDGGETIIPEWADQIWDKVRSKVSLLEMCDKRTLGQTNSYKLPAIDETSLVEGQRFGGLQSYFIGEGNTYTGSKTSTTMVDYTLHKHGVFAYFTNELINDNAYNFGQFVVNKVSELLLYDTNHYIINGSGSGQPTGLLQSDCLVTVDKETDQDPATILYPNLVKMWSRLWPMYRTDAVWLVNQEVNTQLLQMVFNETSGYPAFGGLTFNAHDEFQLRIFGRPVLEMFQCSQLGNEGDIILAALNQNVVVEKPLDVAVSTDFHFNQDEVVYRFTYRWDAKSPWTSAITPQNGTATLSPFVTLQTRGT